MLDQVDPEVIADDDRLLATDVGNEPGLRRALRTVLSRRQRLVICPGPARGDDERGDDGHDREGHSGGRSRPPPEKDRGSAGSRRAGAVRWGAAMTAVRDAPPGLDRARDDQRGEGQERDHVMLGRYPGFKMTATWIKNASATARVLRRASAIGENRSAAPRSQGSS